MSVGFDAAMTAGNSADGLNEEIANAIAISSTGMTVGAGASLLAAVLVFERGSGNLLAPSGLAVAWNGVAMTLGPSISSIGTDEVTVAIASLVNPNTGNHALSATWANGLDCYMSCVSFTGTDTTTGIATADSRTATNTTSITVPSSADGATVAVFGVNGAGPTVNFNKVFSEAPFNPGGGASYQLGGTSNVHTFTGGGGTLQALAGIHILAASGGGGGTSPMFRGSRG